MGDLGGNADDDPRTDPLLAVVRLLDEVLEHLLRHLKVGDHPILHWTNRDDIPWSSAQHLLGLVPHGFDFLGDLVDGDDRRLGDDDPSPTGIDECVGGSEIDREIAREDAEDGT